MSAARHDPTVTFQPIAHAKIAPAPVREATLSRTRLLDRLAEALSCRVTLVVAEAGYGKTTLLADFTRGRAMRCLWYKLESSDRDWVTFVNYLVAAGREAHASFGSATAALLASMAANNPSKELVVSTLLAEFGALGDAPTAFIFDDYHLVDESEDVREIVTRLLKTAPDSLRFVFLSRRRPELPLARLAAQGELAEFDTDELRFSQGETEQLFTEVYRQPLEAEIVAQVDARTEGWAASLQLLHSSIRGRSPAEVRSFVRALSGAQGPLYDFLAEEVLSELPPELQRFLVRASLLERVVPSHAVAVMSTSEPAADEATVVRCITEAERLGLMAKRAATSTSHRFHPLLREFLQRQLIQHVDAEELRAMHLSVARASEEREWLTACHPYIAADQPEQAMRVLGSSVAVAIGTGRWGAAAEIVDRLEGIDPAPAVAVLLARDVADRGHPDRSICLLDAVDLTTVPADVRALVRQARAALQWHRGDGAGVVAALNETVADDETPEPFRELAEVFLLLVGSATDGSLRVLSDRLTSMGEKQSGHGMKFFAGISFHNAMLTEFSRARYRVAFDCGNRALEELAMTGANPREMYSTLASLAACCFELGRFAESEAHGEAALRSDDAPSDVFAELAYLNLIQGHADRALLLSRMARQSGTWQAGNAKLAVIHTLAQAMLALTDGRPLDAARMLGERNQTEFDIGASLALKGLLAVACISAGDDAGAARALEEALRLARSQEGARWETRLRVLEAALDEDNRALGTAVRALGASGPSGMLELADVIAGLLHRLDPVPPEVVESIRRWPGRWLPALRRRVMAGFSPGALAAARSLDRWGGAEDVARLRAFERTYLRGQRAVGLGKGLAKRVSSRLDIADLGRGILVAGERRLTLSEMRGKAASLLGFLLTRPENTATREQVLDALWPELTPDAASNSLNQSLYFLRRHIEPWYEDDVSVNYVRLEGDLVWIDRELSKIESQEFLADALPATRLRFREADALRAFDRYRGRFGPEFEYEEWSIAWRDGLHATYLRLAQALQSHLVQAGRLDEAAEVAQRVLLVDPSALETRHHLIWLYARLGSRSAAAEQYSVYAALHHEEVGDQAPELLYLANTVPEGF